MNSTLFDDGIALSLADFNCIFPFYLALDQNLRIIQAGPSLLRLHPQISLGSGIADWFSMLGSRQEMNFAALLEANKSPLLWLHKPSGLKFKGQLLPIADPPCIVLLWTPWLEDESDLVRYGLESSDFAIHDYRIELLQAQKIALDDERFLLNGFSTERAELIRENHELSRQYSLLWDELVTLKQEESDIYKLSLIASKSESAMVITDAMGKVEWVNEGFIHIAGYSQEEMLGKTPGSMLQGKNTDQQTVEYIRRQIGKCESFAVELVNYRKGGEEFWIQIEAQPILDEENRVVNWMAVERDITKQKAAEIALLEAKKIAEAANRAKSEFLANMSHEIRTPMHGIRGMLDLLRLSPLAPEQEKFADTAAQSVETLLAIINDILDFSKIEAGKLELDHVDFDLRELVEQLCVLLATAAHGKGLELNCFVEPGLPCRLQGDPNRLRQVLTNLIGNAIKFTPAGEISIEVLSVLEAEGRVSVCFTVKDTGIGIHPEDQERLFNPFVQVNGESTRRFGGTGLGLAISKSLVNQMGGEIYVESRPAAGSSFWFTADFKRQPSSSPSELPKHLSNRRILVVDDNETNRTILDHFLTVWGADATLASSAEEALTLLREAHRVGKAFDLALLDYQMPDMDGLMLGRIIANDATLKDMPCILLSSGRSISETERMEAGIYQTMSKPIRPGQLFEAIASSLGNHLPPIKPVETKVVNKPPQFPGRRVLLVEDNPINQKVALKMLEQHNLTVRLKDNGVKALEELESNRYDLVLMDCHMPVMDGYQATRALRDLEKRQNLPYTPVVALTADTVGEARENCLKSGMDDFLSKPFLLGELTEMLSRWLSPSEPSLPDTQTPVWNHQAAVRRLGGDEGLLEELADLYFSEAPKHIGKLLAWQGQQPATPIVEAAHTLKGMTMHFCADKVIGLAALLEQKARQDDVSPADPLFAELVKAVDHLILTLKRDLGKPSQ